MALEMLPECNTLDPLSLPTLCRPDGSCSLTASGGAQTLLLLEGTGEVQQRSWNPAGDACLVRDPVGTMLTHGIMGFKSHSGEIKDGCPLQLKGFPLQQIPASEEVSSSGLQWGGKRG